MECQPEQQRFFHMTLHGPLGRNPSGMRIREIPLCVPPIPHLSISSIPHDRNRNCLLLSSALATNCHKDSISISKALTEKQVESIQQAVRCFRLESVLRDLDGLQHIIGNT